MDEHQKKEPPFELRNGRKIYTMNIRTDSEPRVPPPNPSTEAVANQEAGEGEQESGSSDQPAEKRSPVTSSADEVRVRCRLLSAVDTWSGHPYWGPLFVRNGHDDARALRQVPSLVNSAADNKPIPLMWNHSEDMRDKAGIVVNAAWEDSTDIPPGVNADLVVPRNYDEKAALGLENGMIDATSIWWKTEMERTHPDMDFYTFLELQGKELEGKTVGWLPLKCTRVVHHAMVPAGADEYSGPREEQTDNATHATNAANAAIDTQNTGGETVDLQMLLAVLNSLCEEMGIEAILAEGSQVPTDLGQRLSNKYRAVADADERLYNLTAQIQGLSNAVAHEGETKLTSAEILNRIPERLEMATYGDAFLTAQQNAAVKAFDTAKVDPANPKNLTEPQKRERERLQNSRDLQLLADKIEEYRQEAQNRFGRDMRTTTGDELPPDQSAQNADNRTAEQRRIDAQIAYWKGGKE